MKTIELKESDLDRMKEKCDQIEKDIKELGVVSEVLISLAYTRDSVLNVRDNMIGTAEFLKGILISSGRSI